MSLAETSFDRINDYAAVKISLAKPDDIRTWSFGEVKKPETINYRTYKPEKDGLFCEKIFGPEKDWECACGKYRSMKYKGMTCDRCGVKVAHSKVRRKQMGRIELAAPVVHIWFFKSPPSRLGSLLDMKVSSLEKVIYFQDYVVIDKGDTDLQNQQLLTEEEKREADKQWGPGAFKAEMGAEAVRQLLQKLELVQLSHDLRIQLGTTNSQQKKKDLVDRLRTVESIRDSENRPEWMVLDVIPVIPPDLRPLVPLESGNFATSDLNDLYRRIINRNNRLRKLVDLNAPEVIIRNEKRMLQQSVDALFDNGRCKRPVLGSSSRPLKSLTDMIKGKQGRFRENLLGKRVDYSARSVIVVGPRLKLHQCGLPKKIALELYQPFIIRKLKDLGHADTIKSAKKMLERRDEEVWDILESVIQNHPVLLNRAPTLHRMGIQAFEPVLVEGNAIHLHPLVCKGFNADFDGDQMAVHLPLSIEAQVEAHTLMMSTNNIFAPSNGKPIMSPSQDTVMGCNYITLLRKRFDRAPDHKKRFASLLEADLAYSHGIINLHEEIDVRLPAGRLEKINEDDVREPNGPISTTFGRIMFNAILSPGMPFYNMELGGGQLSMVISDCYQILGRRATIALLDDMNQLGFRESTRSGLSFAADDLVLPPNKPKILAKADKEVLRKRMEAEVGAISNDERRQKVIDIWTNVREQVTAEMFEVMKDDDHGGPTYVNPVYLMAMSGARGGREQIRQLSGMRGLMNKPNGEVLETPIKSNFREGLTVLEYFSSTHGARKGLADTALKTADSGYLTRKLADVAQNVVVTMHDCGTKKGITKSVIYRGERVIVRLSQVIKGRVSRHNIVHPVTDEVIVAENQPITPDIGRKIEELGLEKLQVRSPMTCEAPLGVCRCCYGTDLSTGALVEEGMAVGIIAAQSIGEPGTQLTMRTFHIGGVDTTGVESQETKATTEGIVKFARVQVVTNRDGKQVVLKRNGELTILDSKGRERDKQPVPIGAVLDVKEDEFVKAGQVLCHWDAHSVPILATVAGRLREDDIVEGETLRIETDSRGNQRRIVIDHKGDLRPQATIMGPDGGVLEAHYLPEGAELQMEDGADVEPGDVVAKLPRRGRRNVGDITGGLPRVTDLFEARKPKDPAIISTVDGLVEIRSEKRRGKREVLITDAGGTQHAHLVPPGKRFMVHTGDKVKAGEALVEGPLVLQDILKVSGVEAVQAYLLEEIQQVYRQQNVEINDKHIEIIVSRMLRKVKVSSAGDTKLLPGSTLDRFEVERENENMRGCIKISQPGDTDFKESEIVPKTSFEDVNTRLAAMAGVPAKGVRPKPADFEVQLLGITKASVSSPSFISAASFQETTKVLTEAALAGKVDHLQGLKENVILGHLIPAGTGFRNFQESQVYCSPEAIEALTRARTSRLDEAYPLLKSTPVSEPAAEDHPAAPSLGVQDTGAEAGERTSLPADGGNA